MTQTANTEHPAKKVKTGWEGYTLNCSDAVAKEAHGKHLAELADNPIEVLDGIGPVSKQAIEHLGVHTVRDLAKYKYFLTARSLATLAATETAKGRPKDSVMNVDKALVKSFEFKSFKEIAKAPTSVLAGLSEDAAQLLKHLGVKTVGDLGRWKYCLWAEAIVEAAKHEHTKTEAERKVEKELKHLS